MRIKSDYLKTVSHAKWAQMVGYLNDLIYVCAPAPLQMRVARMGNRMRLAGGWNDWVS